MSTKVYDGKEAVSNLADAAARMTEETKAVMDSFSHITATATEETQSLLTSNQEAFKKGFEFWQEFTQSYANFALEGTQQSLAQSLAFRESLDKIMADNLKKAQALSIEERELFVDATGLFQAQAQAVSEYAANWFTTTSKVMTTTALFSDWAAERVAKMFTSFSANK
ncbi:MAG: hypothetical protein HYR94_30630 [Chloroflexi bacterium]|nr:hypothetical protein [Chloroflexota bacterium]